MSEKQTQDSICLSFLPRTVSAAADKLLNHAAAQIAHARELVLNVVVHVAFEPCQNLSDQLALEKADERLGGFRGCLSFFAVRSCTAEKGAPV